MTDMEKLIAELREAAIQAADVLNSLMPKNPKSKKREWIWTVHNDLVEALSHFTPTENKGGDKGHMPFKEYFASLPAEEQEAAKVEFKKMQYRADQSQICQAQGAACISCDLVDCGDRIYGRRK